MAADERDLLAALSRELTAGDEKGSMPALKIGMDEKPLSGARFSHPKHLHP